MRIPPVGQYLWDWYYDISDRLRRVLDGTCGPIPPSEYMAWRQATGNIVYPSEYAILCAMDVSYVSEVNKELADYRLRQEDERRRNTKGNGQG